MRQTFEQPIRRGFPRSTKSPQASPDRLGRGMRLKIAIVLCAAAALSRGQSPTAKDLAQTSLEDLMNIEVTSVSKKEQKLSQAAAAVFVISQEDIRRSGATNIPDLLRMVPGIHVAQLDANIWAISIRGFTDRYGDKVLVLIDGRSVYTPLTSGVNWDQQDVPLEDIDRIEVIRGPGGTVWGANAVNGVINIITKSAKATQGALRALAEVRKSPRRDCFNTGGRSDRRAPIGCSEATGMLEIHHRPTVRQWRTDGISYTAGSDLTGIFHRATR
jgi:outer membrane cobalamin receptor